MTSLPKTFKLYLKSQGASRATIKNYLSDFNHFWGWLILTLKSNLVPFDQDVSTTIVTQITPQIIAKYKDFLLSNKTPAKTVNRRLSTLRKFGKFAQVQGWISENPGNKVANVTILEQETLNKEQSEKIVAKFAQSLEKEKVSPVTIKNYLSDLRHFLGWIEAVV